MPEKVVSLTEALTLLEQGGYVECSAQATITAYHPCKGLVGSLASELFEILVLNRVITPLAEADYCTVWAHRLTTASLSWT